MSEEPFRALLMKKEIKNKVNKGKNNEEDDMEDSDSDGDNHSDGDSDKFGNGKLYAMRKRGRILMGSSSLCYFILLKFHNRKFGSYGINSYFCMRLNVRVLWELSYH